MTEHSHQPILDFWFNELDPKQWWVKDAKLDQTIGQRFGELHRQATRSELFHWRQTAESALAEVIVLDQFSRNIYRDRPESFASDPLALALAQTAIEKEFDLQLEADKRCFLYMPFMHSESALIHIEAVKLFTKLDRPSNLKFEMRHKAIIDQFGRYPHRNKILGRESTEAEQEFLQQPGSSF